MKLNAETIDFESGGTFQSQGFVVEANDPAIIEILTQKIYNDPYVFPRELLANAMDAGGVYALEMPDALNPQWTVEDHGEGMTHEFMMDGYTRIFHSTKRKDDSQIGGFGHGRLSPIAYTDSYTVRTRFRHTDGVVMEGNYMVYRGENKVPQISCVSLTKSEVEQTGVQVSIPIANRDVAKVIERTLFYGKYITPTPEGCKPVEYLFKTAEGGVRPSSKTYGENNCTIVIGGVPYPYPREWGDAGHLDLFFEVGDLEVTLSRDSINATPAAKDVVSAKRTALLEAYAKFIKQEIEKETTVFDKQAVYDRHVSGISWQLSTFLKIQAPSKDLEAKRLHEVTTKDFAVHLVTSSTDRRAYDGLDNLTKSFRSLTTPLKAFMLTDGGAVKRRAGVAGGMSLSFLGKTNDDFMIFAIPLPYTHGSIKRVKTAIAEHLGAARDKKPNDSISFMLVQYEDKGDLDKIVGLLSNKIKPIHIDSNPKGAVLTRYYPVVVREPGGKLRKCAMTGTTIGKLEKVLYASRSLGTDKELINLAYSAQSYVEPDNTILFIQDDAKDLLPPKSKELKTVLLKNISKDFGYPYNIEAVDKLIQKAGKFRTVDFSQRVAVKIQNGGGRLYDHLLKQIPEKDYPELCSALKIVKSQYENGAIDSDLHTIKQKMDSIKFFIEAKLFEEKELPAPTKKLPALPLDPGLFEAVAKKYPLVIGLSSLMSYDYQARGLSKENADHVVAYLKAFN